MTRRRISLGSGLESAKLADTIQQIVHADPPLPTLTCHSPHMEHAWAHLAARIEMVADAPHVAGWSITCGVSDTRTAEALSALAARSQFSCHIQTAGPFAELAS